MKEKVSQMTLLQAYRAGYIPKKGTTTVAVWCGQCYHDYYKPEDLKKHPRAAVARLKKYMSDQRAARKAAKEAEEAAEAARIELRKNMKTRYQWARLGYVANEDAPWKWGDRMGSEYGKNYLYTHRDNVRLGTPKELEAWWRFFLLELELGENGFVELRTKLMELSPEYPKGILDLWIGERNRECYWD